MLLSLIFQKDGKFFDILKFCEFIELIFIEWIIYGDTKLSFFFFSCMHFFCNIYLINKILRKLFKEIDWTIYVYKFIF